MALPQTHPSCLCRAAQISIPQALQAQLCCSCALLDLNPFCASPHMYCAHDYETWSLQSCLYPWCCFLFVPCCPLMPSASLTSCLFTDICPPPPLCYQDSMRSEPSSLLGFCIKCAQQFGLWRLCTGCCSEMNIVYLCNEHNTSIISVHWAEFLTSCNILSLLQQFHKVNPYLLAHWKSSREIYMWYGIIYFEKVF